MIRRGILFWVLLMPFLLFGQNRYWVANSTTNWSSNSWSSSSGGSADGLGAPTGSQTAIFNGSGIGNCNIDVAASFNNIRVLTGYTAIIDLNGNSFTLNGASTSTFQDGTINDTPGTSSLNFNTTGTINFIGSNFNSSITGSASRIHFSGGIFNNLIDVESNSSGSGSGIGGCVFNDNVKITNSGTGYFLMGNGSPDIFNGNLELVNTSSSRFRIAYNSVGTEINGELIVSNIGGGIWFGENGGTTLLANSKTISIGTGGFSSGEFRLQNFTQLGTTSQNISLTGTAILRFKGSTVFNGNVNFDSPRVFIDGTTFNGSIDVEKTGASSDASTGGNTFIGNAIIRNSGSGYFMLANTNPDVFNGDVTMINIGTNNMYLGNSSAGNSIAGNLTINNNPTGNGTIYLASSNTSSLNVTGNVDVYNNGAANSQNVYLANDGDVTVAGNVLIENAVTGTANSSQVYIASGANSSAVISGSTLVKNGGSNTTSRVYIGNGGDVTFNGTLDIVNSATATNSEVHCGYNVNSSNIYNENITVSSTNALNDGVYFSNSAGSGVLASGKSVTIGTGGFIGRYLYFRNFTQTGTTVQNLTLTGDARLESYNSDWGGNLIFSAPTFFTRDTRYRGTADFTKTGTTADHSSGGNQFDLDLTMNNTGSGTFSLGNTNPDAFGNDVMINNTGSGRINIAYNSPGNTIARDLIIANSGSGSHTEVVVCSGNLSSLTIGRNCTVTNSASSINGYVYIGNSGFSTIIGGNLTVDNVASSTNGRVYIGQSNIFTLNGNLTINNAGTTPNGIVYLANGASSVSTINGVSLVTNSGTGNNSEVYLGGSGDVTFNNDLSISNNSSAINSRVYCNNSATSSNIYNGNILLESTNANTDGIYFGNGGGSGVLVATKTVSLNSGGFVAGQLYFRNFTQTGNTVHSIILDPSGTGTFYNYDSDWGGDVTFSGPSFLTRGTRYRRTSILSKTGTSSDYSIGGNVYNDDLTLTNSGSGYVLMGATLSDDFQSDVTLNNTGTSIIYLAYNSAGNTIGGNLTATNSATGTASTSIILGNSSSAELTIAGNVTLLNNGSATTNNIYLGASGQVSSVGGFVDATNSATGTNSNIYIASSNTFNLGGDLNIKNIATSSNQNVYLSNSSSSSSIIGGNTKVLNSGIGTTSRVYLSNSGSAVFNGTLEIENNSSAINSQIYINHTATSNNIFNENIIVESYDSNSDGIFFGSSNGSATLAANKTITIGTNGYIAGQLLFRNFTQVGPTAQTLNLLPTGTGFFTNYDSDWGGDVNFSSPRMYTRGTMYRGISYLEKTGANDDNSIGGNTFVGVSELKNIGSANFLMGNGNPDVFQSDLTLNNLGSDNMYLAYNSAGNTIAGDLMVNMVTNGTSSCYTYLSQQSSSTLSIAGNVTLNNTSSSTNSYIHLGDNGDVDVQGDLSITNSPTSSSSGDIYVADGTSSIVNIVGNVLVNNTGSSNNNRLYFYNYGSGTVDGTVSLNNNSTGDRAYTYVANNSSSNVVFNSTLDLFNSGANTTKQSYLGNQGSITFNGDVKISNNASANSSQVYVNNSATSTNTFNENIVVESYNVNCDGVLFGNSNGSATLAATKTITLGSNGHIAGELRFRNFTQVGSTAQTLNLLSTGTGYFTNYDSDWGGNVNFSGPRMYTRGTMYRGTSYLEKTGTNDDNSIGGNTFVGVSELKNTGSANFLMGNGSPDVFQSDLTMNNLGTDNMQLAYNSAGNSIAGDLIVNQASTGTSTSQVNLSQISASTLSIAGNVMLNNTSSATNSSIYFGDAGDVDVQGTFDLLNNSTSSNISDFRLANSSSSTVSIVGNTSLLNNSASNRSYMYMFNSGNGTIDGTVNVLNNCTGDQGYVYVGNSSSSYATFNSTIDFINLGSNSTTYTYVGSNGDLTFNDDVSLSNNSTAVNSSCYFNSGATSNGLYNGNISIESYGTNCDGIRFGSSGGFGTLATGKTVSLGSNGFTDGYLYFRNFTQLGSTAQAITTTNNSRFENYNSLWNANVTFISPRLHTRQTTYNGITYLEKTGSNNDASYGANVYNDDVTFKNSGTGYFMPTNNNASDHNGNVTYIKTATGLIYPTYSSTSTYAGDINIDFNTTVNFGSSNGRVLMDGTTGQSINDIGTSPEPNFRRLRTNNLTNEITLNTPINIQTELDLITGNIISDATNYITMRDNSTVANVSDNAFVDGPLQKRGNELFEFPVGKNGVYRPIQISAPSSSSAQFIAEFFPTDPHINGWNQALKDPTLNHISNCEYWILNRTNTTNSVNVRLYYDSYGTSSCSGVDNQSELAVTRWNGSMWKDHGNGSWGGTTGDGWVETSGVVTSFSPFTLASTTTNNPLPIELVAFSALENKDVVDLFWETASEIDNDYFTIERSNDGINYVAIEKISGAGNSSQNIEYSTVDKEPLNGVSYYRLKQTDFNGEFSYSDIEVVNFSKANEVIIYPNPVQDVLTIEGLSFDDIISVYSVDGKLIYKGVTAKLNVETYSNGVYQLVVSHKNGTQENLKFIK